MPTDIINSIIENLFYVLPIIHKKLLKVEPHNIAPDFSLTRLHVGIMAVLNENTIPISEIARTFLMPKPQMTRLINQLVGAGLVEKQPDPHDRRVARITLTPKGKETFRQSDELLKNNVRRRLSYLNEQELEDLSTSLQKLREIGSRLEKQGKITKSN